MLDPMERYAQDSFDGLGSKVKKGLKKAKSYAKKSVSSPKAFVKTVATIAAAPMVVPTMLGVKATTHVLSKTGAKPLKQLNAVTDRLYKSGVASDMRAIAAVEAGIGAVIGGAILAAPAIASAAGSVGASTAIEAATAAASIVGGAAAGGGAPSTPAEQSMAATEAAAGGAAQPSGAKGVLTVLAPAGAGLVVAGPVGALVGLGAGLFLKSRSK